MTVTLSLIATLEKENVKVLKGFEQRNMHTFSSAAIPLLTQLYTQEFSENTNKLHKQF